jgi:hypothetical protein
MNRLVRVRRYFASACLALTLPAAACVDTLIGPPPATTNSALFDQLWRDVDRHYPFLEYKHLNWDSLGAVYRPRAVEAQDADQLAAVLGGLLGELRDDHVSLSAGGGAAIRFIGRTAAGPFDAETMIHRYVSGAATTAGKHVVYGELAPGVGYLRVPSFRDDGWTGEIDTALFALAARGVTGALVIDLRGNMGGERGTAIAAAGRFADRTRTFGYLRFRAGAGHGDFSPYAAERVAPAGAARFRGPVYLLADREVLSAAEEFVLAMRALPTTTVVGDTTGGASGGPVVRELSNGWTYQLSQWIEYTAVGAIYENIGLAPDVAVAPDDSEAGAGRDRALERAIALASGRIAATAE